MATSPQISILTFTTAAAALLLLLGCSTTIQAWRYEKAFTVYSALSSKDFRCLYYQASVPAIRVYAGGKVDSNGISNIQNAQSAGFKAMEVYVQPDAHSAKPGWQQFDEAKEYVNKQFTLKRVWLLVTDPRSWTSSADANVNFIRSFVQEAIGKNVAVGIYTSWYDWLLITNDYQNLQQYCGSAGCQLWYWHTLGQGPKASSSADFSDFRLFGSFKTPGVKEYDIVDSSICSVYVNWSVYLASANNGKQIKSNGKEREEAQNWTSPRMKAAIKMVGGGQQQKETRENNNGQEVGSKGGGNGTATMIAIGNAFGF